jgi:hypothetical protein
MIVELTLKMSQNEYRANNAAVLSQQDVVVNAGQFLLERKETIIEDGDGPVFGLRRATLHSANSAHKFHVGADTLAKSVNMLESVAGGKRDSPEQFS